MKITRCPLLTGSFLTLALATLVGAAAPAFADQDTASSPPIAFADLRAKLPSLRGEIRLGAVESGGAPVDLSLQRFEVYTPDAVIVVVGSDGRARSVPAPDVAYFSGSVIGQPNSHVYLALAADGTVTGLVRDEGGNLAKPEPAVSGRDRDVLRLRPLAADAAAADHSSFTCGQPSLPLMPDTNASAARMAARIDEPAAVLAGTVYRARIAVETDYEFRQLFGSSAAAQAYVGDLIGYASTIYRREVATQLQVSFLRLWETSADPWTQTSTRCQLFQFGKHWNDHMTGQARTIAHMLSGKGNGGGVAWLNALCRAPQDYSIGTSCPGLASTSNYFGDYGFTGNLSGNFNSSTPTSVWDIFSTAHEIGHNFGSPHTHCYNGVGGISSPVDQCYGSEAGCYSGPRILPGPPSVGSGTIMSYCHQLSGGSSNIALTFGGEPGDEHPYGVMPLRVPSEMRSFVVSTAETSPSCLPVMNGYTVGGSVNGLIAGQAVVLRNTTTVENLTRDSNGGFAFETIQDSGAGYNIIVQTQPAGQVCVVSNGSGIIATENITNVSVNCETSTPTATRSPTRTPTMPPGGTCNTSVTTLGTANVNSGTAGSSLAVTVGAAGVAAGDSIMMGFTMDQTAGAVSCSDSAGNAYTVEVDRTNGSDLRMVMCAAYNVVALAAGQMIQVSHPNTTSSRNLTVQKISGLAAAALDRKASTVGSGTAPTSGLTAATTQADEMLYGVIGHRGNVVDFTAGASFSLTGPVGSTTSGNRSTEAEFRLVSATGQYAATGTLSPSRNWAAGILTLRCGGAAPPDTATPTPTNIGPAPPTPTRTSTSPPTPSATSTPTSDGAACNATVTTVGTANVNSGTTGSSLVVTVGAAGVPAGDSIMVGFTMDQTAGAVSCSDSAGNAYTVEVDRTNGSDLRMVMCAAYNVVALAAGQTMRVSHPNTTNSRNLTVQRISGLAAAPLDRKASNVGSGRAPTSGLTAVTSQADGVLYGVIGHRGNTVDFTAGAGFTLTGPVGSTTGGNRSTEAEFRLVSATGQYAATGTLNPPRNWAAGILTFRCAGAAPP